MSNRKTSIEDVRAYWNRSPCNIKHSKREPGTKEYYNEVEKKKYFVEPHILRFANFPAWRNKKVLEIGCGIGTDTINFARHGAQVTAVDLSDRSIEIAKRRACIFDLKENIRFICCDCEKLSSFVPGESFDLIYAFGVLHHTINPSKAVEEIRKVMHKDSELRIMLYSRYSIKRLEIMLGLCTPQAQPGEPILRTTTANAGERDW